MAKVAYPARRDDRLYTYGDYASWPDGERWELIDGVAFDMSPAPSPRHQLPLGSLYEQIRSALEGRRGRGFMAPLDVRLPEADEKDADVRTVVQPDLVVVCDPSEIDDSGCRGAPDLVVEVLSPSTAYKDQTRKLTLYERHGVREYWVANPEVGNVLVHGLDSGGRHGRPEVLLREEAVVVSAVPGLSIDLAAVFAD